MRLRRGSAATVAPPHSSTERNKTMKLTKTQIKEKQEADSRTRGGVRVAPSGAPSSSTGCSDDVARPPRPCSKGGGALATSCSDRDPAERSVSPCEIMVRTKSHPALLFAVGPSSA